MRRVLCAFMITTLLAGCGPRATNTANAPAVANTPAPAATNAPGATAEGSDPFVGRWRVAGDEGPDKGDLMINAAGDGYQISLDVGSVGCGGGVKGPGKRQGDVLHMLYQAKDDEGSCGLSFTRKADGTLDVAEEEGRCSDFHGAQCDFNGTATRKPAGRSPARN
jgi:hypothetical protein